MKRLFIDLEVCYRCRECVAKCSYPHHPENNGIVSLLEEVARVLVCRKCEDAPCVVSCPNEALEKREDGVVVRHTMLCTGCGTCSLACPFGTIYPEIIPYLVSRCDYCIGRVEDQPLCVETCPYGALRYEEVEEDKEKDIYLIGDHLAVHSIPWIKEEVK